MGGGGTKKNTKKSEKKTKYGSLNFAFCLFVFVCFGFDPMLALQS